MHPIYLTHTAVSAASPLELIDIAAANGFDGFTLRLIGSGNLPFFPVMGKKALIGAIKQAAAQSHLKMLEICSLYIVPDLDFSSYLAAMELAADMGAPYATALCRDPEPARQQDQFGRLCDAAAKLGLTIGVEATPTSEIHTVQDALRFLAAVGRRNTSIVVDPAHFSRAGSKPADLAGIDPKLFLYTQFNDLDVASNEHKMPGEGDLPLREILASLPAGIPIALEVLAPKGSAVEPRDWAARIAQTTRAFLKP
jgi:sugar phosphate isomerase/epimerase